MVQKYLSYGGWGSSTYRFFLQFVFLCNYIALYVCICCAEFFDYFGIVYFVFGIIICKLILTIVARLCHSLRVWFFSIDFVVLCEENTYYFLGER